MLQALPVFTPLDCISNSLKGSENFSLPSATIMYKLKDSDKFIVKGAVTAAVASGASILVVKYVLDSLHANVGVEKPTKKQIQEEDPNQHALFRHLPQLKRQIAWRKLGNFPTPIHHGKYYLPNTKDPLTFYVKREDMSSTLYGGNKVRTLQHQLAVCEAKDPTKKIYVTGTGGSNQILATIVHGYKQLKLKILPLWMSKDVPDLDNTLNMLSSLSFIGDAGITWANMFSVLRSMLVGIFSDDCFVLPPGGNNPAGVLGQVGGLLELAEQIQRQEVPDPNGIFLPIGSSCTITGLIIGVALCRHLDLPVFQSKAFTIHGIPIHHVIASASRSLNFFKASWSQYVPLSIRHSIVKTCEQIQIAGGPDLKSLAINILDKHCKIHDDAELIGLYGGHSKISKDTASQYDKFGDSIRDHKGIAQKPLWLCGHFAAKAFAQMTIELQKDRSKKYIFWQTKSAVQPRGTKDEWKHLKNMPDSVLRWANKGEAHSILRQGKVNTDRGDASGYRHLMTQVVDSNIGPFCLRSSQILKRACFRCQRIS